MIKAGPSRLDDQRTRIPVPRGAYLLRLANLISRQSPLRILINSQSLDEHFMSDMSCDMKHNQLFFGLCFSDDPWSWISSFRHDWFVGTVVPEVIAF